VGGLAYSSPISSVGSAARPLSITPKRIEELYSHAAQGAIEVVEEIAPMLRSD
jgi:hypothetical protein